MCWRRGEVRGTEDGAATGGHYSLRGEESWEDAFWRGTKDAETSGITRSQWVIILCS
jgi:hypothetical protein